MSIWNIIKITLAMGGSFYAGCALTMDGVRHDTEAVATSAQDLLDKSATLRAENAGLRDANDRCVAELPDSDLPAIETNAQRAEFVRGNLAHLRQAYPSARYP